MDVKPNCSLLGAKLLYSRLYVRSSERLLFQIQVFTEFITLHYIAFKTITLPAPTLLAYSGSVLKIKIKKDS